MGEDRNAMVAQHLDDESGYGKEYLGALARALQGEEHVGRALECGRTLEQVERLTAACYWAEDEAACALRELSEWAREQLAGVTAPPDRLEKTDRWHTQWDGSYGERVLLALHRLAEARNALAPARW